MHNEELRNLYSSPIKLEMENQKEREHWEEKDVRRLVDNIKMDPR
jgi:hypothetical protein